MLGHPGLDLDARPRRAAAAAPDQPRRTDQERQCVLGRREPCGQQVEVDVEEGHRRGAAHPVQHGLGSDERGCRGEGLLLAATGPGHLPDLDPEERRQLLAQPAHTGPQRLHAQPSAGDAHERPGLTAARARQDLLVPRPAGRRAAAGTTGQFPAVPARQQAGAARAVVHAHERTALRRRGIAQHGPGQAHELLGEHARPRVRTAAVHSLERRPPRPLLVGGRPQVAKSRLRPQRDRWDR